MKPSARLYGAIEILRAILLDSVSPEKAVTDWGRAHRFAGSSDRRAIQDTVYDVLRYYGSLCHYMNSDDPYLLVAGWVFFIKQQQKSLVNDLFNGEKHSPKKLSKEALKLFKSSPEKLKDFQSLYNIHHSLENLFTESLGDQLSPTLLSLSDRAPLDIRVNLSKISLDNAILQLQDIFPETKFETVDAIPTLIRTYDNIRITDTDLYQNGFVEIQDGACQYACKLIAEYYNPNGRILDYCAGGGGKILALADYHQGKSEMIAADISEIRLKSLKQRAKRAGLDKDIRTININRLSPDKGLFYTVLVDAPCSGTGTWRRNVWDRWITTPEKITEYTTLQSEILSSASQFVEKNGLLVYMTCSLLKVENDTVIQNFLQDHTQFSMVSLTETTLGNPSQFGLCFNPATDNTDGFYISILKQT